VAHIIFLSPSSLIPRDGDDGRDAEHGNGFDGGGLEGFSPDPFEAIFLIHKHLVIQLSSRVILIHVKLVATV
jgi:hypothetical protein